MKETVVARRYAKAIFELALEAGELDRVAGEMAALVGAAARVPAMLAGLSDERVDGARRVAVAGKIAAAMQLSAVAGNALKLLVAKGRAAILPLVAQDFERRAEHHAKLMRAEAVVAEKGAAAAVQERIEQILSAALGTKARCDVAVDETLLGGFALRVGDVRYDASYRGKLERMKEQLR